MRTPVCQEDIGIPPKARLVGGTLGTRMNHLAAEFDVLLLYICLNSRDPEGHSVRFIVCFVLVGKASTNQSNLGILFWNSQQCKTDKTKKEDTYTTVTVRVQFFCWSTSACPKVPPLLENKPRISRAAGWAGNIWTLSPTQRVIDFPPPHLPHTVHPLRLCVYSLFAFGGPTTTTTHPFFCCCVGGKSNGNRARSGGRMGGV